MNVYKEVQTNSTLAIWRRILSKTTIRRPKP